MNQDTLHRLVDIISSYFGENHRDDTPVVNYLQGEELKKTADLTLPAKGVDEEELLRSVQEYLHYSVRTTHPGFNNQLYSTVSLPSLIGEIVTAITNTSMATYEIAPVATLIEKELVNKLNGLIGFRTEENEGEGIMVTGGSNANMIAMLAARNKAVPGVKEEGLAQNNLVIFISDQAHYSFDKGMNMTGLGTNNIIKVATDAKGRMKPEALEDAINRAKESGKKPFFIGATAGTTVLGGFDPFEEIAAIARQHNLWMHVDAAWGGAVALSRQHNHLIKGVERADSFNLDAHKLMGVPLIASFFLCKHKGTLLDTNQGGGSAYIFHPTENAHLDTGPASLQCGRRVDALKLWLNWKAIGDEGYEQAIDELFERASYFTEKVRAHPQIQLYNEPTFLNICFRVIPPNGHEEINTFNYKLRQQLVKDGKFLVNYATAGDDVFFRMVITKTETKEEDLDRLIEEILSLAEQHVGVESK